MVGVTIVIIIWLVIVSVTVLVMRNHYQRLVEFGGKNNLEKILEKVLDRLEEDRMDLGRVNKEVEKLTREGEIHIQKVGLIRFNPFPETGGDQSFVLALLDKNNNGVIVSSLHARMTTRWYAKAVVNGKGKEIELSKEEEKAIIKAETNLKNKK